MAYNQAYWKKEKQFYWQYYEIADFILPVVQRVVQKACHDRLGVDNYFYLNTVVSWRQEWLPHLEGGSWKYCFGSCLKATEYLIFGMRGESTTKAYWSGTDLRTNYHTCDHNSTANLVCAPWFVKKANKSSLPAWQVLVGPALATWKCRIVSRSSSRCFSFYSLCGASVYGQCEFKSIPLLFEHIAFT